MANICDFSQSIVSRCQSVKGLLCDEKRIWRISLYTSYKPFSSTRQTKQRWKRTSSTNITRHDSLYRFLSQRCVNYNICTYYIALL